MIRGILFSIIEINFHMKQNIFYLSNNINIKLLSAMILAKCIILVLFLSNEILHLKPISQNAIKNKTFRLRFYRIKTRCSCTRTISAWKSETSRFNRCSHLCLGCSDCHGVLTASASPRGRRLSWRVIIL